MAYGLLAGIPPIYGLYAGIVPLLLYAFFGTSRQLSVGPVALVSLLVLTGVAEFAEPGSPLFISLAISTALIAGGIIQIILGGFRLGFLINFLSHPVISGFTSAAAFIIGLSQLKNLFGVDISRSNRIHEVIGSLNSAY
jgi:SulP family sulfate permease